MIIEMEFAQKGLVKEAPRWYSSVGPPGGDEAAALLDAFLRERSPAVRERLVELHLPLVRSIARRYAYRGEPLEDRVRVGEADDSFDPRGGNDFVRYAIPTIAGEIRNHLRDRVATIREPRRAVAA